MFKKITFVLMLCVGTQLLVAQKWVKTIETPNTEIVNVLKILPDGDLLIGGHWRAFGNHWQGRSLLLCTTPDGEVKWEKRFGKTDIEGNPTTYESVEDMAVMASGDAMLVGFSQPVSNTHKMSNVLLARYGLNGNELWRKYYNLGGGEAGFGVAETQDGGVIVCGRSNYDSLNGYDCLAMKISANGTQEWVKTWGQEYDDAFDKVLRTPDGHFLLVGTIQLPFMGNRLYVVKVDALGNTIWERQYEGESTIRGRDAVLLPNGGLRVAGMGYVSNFVPMVAELAPDGSLVWSQTYNSTDFGDFYGLAVCESGNFYAVGIGSKSPFDGLMVLNAKPDGKQSSLDIYYADTPGSDFAKSVAIAPDGGIIIAGNKTTTNNYDIALMRLENAGCKPFTVHTSDVHGLIQASQPSPNPFTEKSMLTLTLAKNGSVLLEVFDLNGRLTWSQEQTLSAGEQQLEIPAAAVPAGQMAFYRLLAGGGVATGKIMRE